MKRSCVLYGCIVLIISVLSVGCQSVKPYQRVYLNDSEMKTGKRQIERFENSVQAYREGATGGGGKGSGGCGCN